MSYVVVIFMVSYLLCVIKIYSTATLVVLLILWYYIFYHVINIYSITLYMVLLIFIVLHLTPYMVLLRFVVLHLLWCDSYLYYIFYGIASIHVLVMLICIILHLMMLLIFMVLHLYSVDFPNINGITYHDDAYTYGYTSYHHVIP